MGFVESGCLGQMETTILKIANRAMVMVGKSVTFAMARDIILLTN